MKQTILILSIISAAWLAGCKSETGVRDDGTVRFAAYQPAVTKVTGTSFDPMDEIAVFAPLGGNAINGTYDEIGLPAKDRRYVADNNNNFAAKTEADKIRYTTLSTNYDFYAVYPAMGPGPKYAIVDQTTYKIDLGDMADQRTVGNVLPYMYSNDAKGKGPGSGVVPLTFRYVFSKISLTVDYDPIAMEEVLSRVEIFADNGLYRECVIDLTQGVYTKLATNGGRNVLATAEEPYVFRTPLAEEPEARTEGYIIPGATVNPMIRLTFGDPTVTIDTGNGGGVTNTAKVYRCRIPTAQTGGKFEAGKEYHYEIQVLATNGEVGIAGTIEDWEVVGGVPPIMAE